MTTTRAQQLVFIASFLVASLANAAGYEKSIMWGGRSAGLAGVATPYAQGAEALYQNPAGLALDKAGSGAAVFVSPTWNPMKGPFNNNNDIVSSENKVSTPAALLYNYAPNETWGFGAGFYVAGGSVIGFKDLAYTGAAGALSKSHVGSDLELYEASLGAGYKVNDKLKVGAAWRAEFAKASFAFAQRAVSGAALINAEVNGIRATNFGGLRLGAEYKMDEKTSFGLSYRSPVIIKGKGNYGGTFRKPAGLGGDVQINQTEAKASTEFPQQLNIGGMHKCTDTWNVFAEYAWTDYSKVDHVTIDGALSAGATALSANPDDLKQQWHDQHNIKLAGEYTGYAMPIRFGYEYVTMVTSKNFARLSSAPPTAASGVTLGSEFKASDALKFDLAGEYAILNGTGNGAAAGTQTNDIRAGDYKALSYAIHLGAEYNF